MLTQNKNNFNFLLTWKTPICILLSKVTTSYGKMSGGSLKHSIWYILTKNLYWPDFRIRHGFDTWEYFLTYDVNENRSFSTGRYFRISVKIIWCPYLNKSIIQKRTNQLKKIISWKPNCQRQPATLRNYQQTRPMVDPGFSFAWCVQWTS